MERIKMAEYDFSPYDSAHYLETEEEVQGYLDDIVGDASSSPALIAHAFGVAARARNLSALARKAGMSRQGLIKALSGANNPSFATIKKVAGALGYEIKIVPAQKRKKAA